MIEVPREYRDYSDYIGSEWKQFHERPERAAASLKVTENIEVRRVLDIGCGSGQEMLPFVERGALGFGMDVAREVGLVGRKLFVKRGFGERVSFLCGSGNEIPFADASFDVIICRGALMFMDNQKALAEMSRVLRPGGVFLLRVLAPLYYWGKIKEGIRIRHYKSSIHALRVLAAGEWYLLTGRQSFSSLTAGGEIFRTSKSLSRDLERVGLKIVREMPDTEASGPSFLVTKNASK